MKGNKKLLVVAALLLLITVSFTTYAIYKSSATGTGSVTAANWVVEVNGADITEENSFTLGSITWATPTVSKVAGRIAPGDHGTVDVTIDADGSQVDVTYTIAIGAAAPDGFTIAAGSGSSLTGTITYSATAGEMEVTVPVEITWTATDDPTVNEADINLANTEISIPIVVTATQSPNPAA